MELNFVDPWSLPSTYLPFWYYDYSERKFKRKQTGKYTNSMHFSWVFLFYLSSYEPALKKRTDIMQQFLHFSGFSNFSTFSYSFYSKSLIILSFFRFFFPMCFVFSFYFCYSCSTLVLFHLFPIRPIDIENNLRQAA